MAHVTVTIAGRTYRMACEDGQEGHLRDLAKRLDDIIGNLRGIFGEIGDQRLTVMAAIMVMDELVAANKKAKTLEGEAKTLRDNRDALLERYANFESVLARQIDEVARRMEVVAQALAKSGAAKKA